MKDNTARFINAKMWVAIIFAVNIGLFGIYIFSHTGVGFFDQLWSYLDSGLFKLVTGSLVLPLLFSVLEKRYKFIENMEREREDRRKRNEEIKRQTRQQAIDDTIAMWQDLYSLSTDVILLKDGEDFESMVDDISRKMINFSNKAEHIVNKWSHQFTNLTYDDHDLFLEFVNILYQSGDSVIYYLRTTEDNDERSLMKDMLYQIRDQVKSIANHTTINVLKNSAEYLRLKDGYGTDEKIAEAKAKIDEDLEKLRGWYNEVRNLDKQYDNFLVPLKGDHIQQIRQTARNIETWLLEDKKRYFFQADDFNSFENQYKQIPVEERLEALRVPYSKEYLRALTNWFSLESACNFVYNRAHGAW